MSYCCVFFPQSLRKALRIMGAPNLLAENMEYGLSYSVVSYLKKLSQQVRSWVGCCVLLTLGTYHRKSASVHVIRPGISI